MLLKQKFRGLWHFRNQRSLFKFILMKQQQTERSEWSRGSGLLSVRGLRTRKFHARTN